jgi:hypothetical protein
VALRLHRLQEFLDARMALGVGASVEVAGSPAESLCDVERGVVLGEPACGSIPLSCRRAGCGSVADGVGDRIWALETRDPRSDSQVVLQQLVDRIDLSLGLRSSAEDLLRLCLVLSQAFDVVGCTVRPGQP